MSTILYLLAIHTSCRTRIVDPRAHLIASLEVHVLDVKGVDVAWEIAQDREEDVDEKVDAAASYEEDADWGHENCEND